MTVVEKALEMRGILVDAIYTKVKSKRDEKTYYDYSQIMTDFEFTQTIPRTRALIVASIQLSISEIMYRDESNWIIDESFSRPKLLTSGLPTTSNHNSIILLVPHLMLCEHDCITMSEV